MRRKSLFAGLLTASLIFSSAPATVFAKQGAKKKTAPKISKVQVTNLPANTLILKKGKSKKLKVKVVAAKKVSKKVIWKSSNKKIVQVTNGTVKAKKKGKANVTVYAKADKKKKFVIKVTVGTPVTKVKLDR